MNSAIQRLDIDPVVAEPALTTPLPAGGQATAQRQHGLPAIETDRLQGLLEVVLKTSRVGQ